MKTMKTQKEVLKTRQTYQSPKAEIIELVTQGVLCASAIRSNSPESVGISSFDWI